MELTNACDDGSHDDNDENNEVVEVIWGPPSPTIDFVQPSATPLTLTLGSAALFTTLMSIGPHPAKSYSAVVDRRT